MNTVVPRRFSPYLLLPKVGLILAVYLPYWLAPEAVLNLGDKRFPVVMIGLYLAISMVLRSLSVMERLPLWVKTAWIVVDYVAWLPTASALRWTAPPVYVGMALCTDAAMLGWSLRRGVVHTALLSLLIFIGPSFDGTAPALSEYVWRYLIFVTPGVLFCYGFVYMAGRMSEEREEAARARKEAELANTHLQEYARQVEDLAVLKERNRLARDVHDTIAHAFTGIIMQLEAVNRLLERDSAKAAAALAAVQDQARDSLAEVRRSVHALRPLQMEEKHGPDAIGKLVEEFHNRTGVNATMEVMGLAPSLPAAYELCLYRAVQEGLSNAFSHGRATEVRVRLAFETDRIVLMVANNGRTTPGKARPGMGIMGIRERVGVLGGAAEAGPAESGGFVLNVTLPLTQPGGSATA